MLRRVHFTALYCRKRRWHYGKLDPEKFFRVNVQVRLIPDPNGVMVMPKNAIFFGLFIDPARRFAKVKARLLKACLTIAEMLAN